MRSLPLRRALAKKIQGPLLRDYKNSGASWFRLEMLSLNTRIATWMLGFDWRLLAERAIELGDLEIAGQALEKVSADEGRGDVEDSLRAARGRSMSPNRALKNARTIVDPTIRSRSLCEIAERRASAGDDRGAAAIFQLALHAAEDIDQFKVFSINDIAWAQIRSGDTQEAEKALDWALKENGRPRLGSDQIDGWAVLADTLAYLGEFERARETVMRISDSSYRGRGLGFIASRRIEANRLQETVDWASKLSSPEDRAETFLRIAQALVGQVKAAPANNGTYAEWRWLAISLKLGAAPPALCRKEGEERGRYKDLAMMRVMSSCCSRGLKRWTSSTTAASKSFDGRARWRQRAAARRSSPNSSSASLKDSVMPSV